MYYLSPPPLLLRKLILAVWCMCILPCFSLIKYVRIFIEVFLKKKNWILLYTWLWNFYHFGGYIINLLLVQYGIDHFNCHIIYLSMYRPQVIPTIFLCWIFRLFYVLSPTTIKLNKHLYACIFASFIRNISKGGLNGSKAIPGFHFNKKCQITSP